MNQPPACRNTFQIQVNGQPLQVTADWSVKRLLDHLSLRGGPVAVECNRQLIPTTQHAERMLQSGDQLEIVSLTGGG